MGQHQSWGERIVRGRPFVIEWALADTPEALKRAYQAERDPQRRSQLHGLWLLRQGWRLPEVSEAVGVDYRMVQRWAAWYRAGAWPSSGGTRWGAKAKRPS